MGYDSTSVFVGVMVLSALQCVNIIAIINFTKISDLNALFFPTFPKMIITTFVLTLLNFLRHLKYCTYSELDKIWTGLKKGEKTIRTIITLLYIASTFTLLLFSIY